MRRSMAGKVSLVALGAALLAPAGGCGGEDDEPTTTVRGAGRPAPAAGKDKGAGPKAAGKETGEKAATGSAPAGAVIPEAGPYTYKPVRDPFQSYFDLTGETQQPVTLLPLQKHDLSKFKLTAVITGTVQPAAVILDPNGKAHFIKRGTLLGPPRGRVAQILSDRVVVEREFKDRLERVHKLKSELRLRADDDEQQQAKQQ